MLARVFATREFLTLWLAQLVSAFGDWIGFLAIIVVAERIGGATPGSAIALVMIARVLPGFFLASVGGVIVDRLDRKRLLIACDIVRAGTMLTIPLIDTLWALVLASLVLELATSLWGPAKEAIVPNVVPTEHLTAANSLSLVAAYGTFPFAAAAFAGLSRVSLWIGDAGAFGFSGIGRESLALTADAMTFLVAAALIASMHFTRRSRSQRAASSRRVDLGAGIRELREGWRFIFLSPRVRAVLVALGTGMLGGGMLIPLGAVFNHEVLGADEDGFGLILTFLGVGVAVGVGTLSALQARLDKDRVFVASVLAAGLSLFFASTVSEIELTLLGVALLGVSAGGVYVLGFTILHESVDDELRGRVFSALYVLVRFCLLLSIAVGGFLSEALDWVFATTFDSEISIGSNRLALTGVRGALWLAAATIVGAGVLAIVSLRADRGPRRATLLDAAEADVVSTDLDVSDGALGAAAESPDRAGAGSGPRR